MPEDVAYLHSAAASSGFRSINFPEGVNALERKIDVSQRSFRGKIADEADQEFMFTVLSGHEAAAIPIGSSTLYPKHGTAGAPHNAYLRNGDPADPFLSLVTDLDGPAEVGAIVVHAALQGAQAVYGEVDVVVESATHRIKATGGYGRAASWTRFLWTAMPHHRHRFVQRSCLAEMLPPLIDDPNHGRTNAFYEQAIRPHMGGRTYGEMDLETLKDRTLVSRRLPPKIRVNDLPAEARDIIGQVGPKSQPALKLLQRLGFKDTHCVDPLDAGPHYAGRFSENPIFSGAQEFLFGGSSHYEREIGWTYGLLGLFRPDRGVFFRAALAPFFIVEDHIFMPPDVSEGLFLHTIGTQVTAVVAPL